MHSKNLVAKRCTVGLWRWRTSGAVVLAGDVAGQVKVTAWKQMAPKLGNVRRVY